MSLTWLSFRVHILDRCVESQEDMLPSVYHYSIRCHLHHFLKSMLLEP
jgi:hypothetical protein